MVAKSAVDHLFAAGSAGGEVGGAGASSRQRARRGGGRDRGGRRLNIKFGLSKVYQV